MTLDGSRGEGGRQAALGDDLDIFGAIAAAGNAIALVDLGILQLDIAFDQGAAI